MGFRMIWIENANTVAASLVNEHAELLLEYVSEREFSVAQLELSPRARNVLRLNGIVMLGQLLQVDQPKLLAMDLMDEKTEREIQFALAAFLEDHADEIRSYRPKASRDASEIEKSEDHGDAGRASELLSTAEGRKQIISALRAGNKLVPVELLGLSNRAYNCIKRLKKNDIADLLEMYPDGYFQIKNAGRKTVDELQGAAEAYVRQYLPLIQAWLSGEDVSDFADAEPTAGEAQAEPVSLRQMFEQWGIDALLIQPDARERLLKLAEERNDAVEGLGLSVRAQNAADGAGASRLHELMRYYPDRYSEMKNAGKKTITELQTAVENYAETLRQDILLYGELMEDVSEPKSYPEAALRKFVMAAFREVGFQGLHYEDVRESCPPNVIETELKRAIGKLIHDGSLEYVDYRLYKRYPSALRYIRELDALSDREREVLLRRLDGEKLDEIGQRFDVTRERVRQIETKACAKIKKAMGNAADALTFDEAYYAGLYTSYDVPQDFWDTCAAESEHVKNVLFMFFDKGTAPLRLALEDERLDVALRIRVQQYLDRDMIYLDGQKFPPNRSALEEHVLRTRCRENTTFDAFADLYNSVLRQNRIPLDSDLYLTESVRRTRMNAISDSHFCLWKFGKVIRYYDVDSGDYTELYEALGLEDYENTEVSTLKYMEAYPELMEKYDIRDQYELHNLLRKTIRLSDYHSLDVRRQPMLRFGNFDREAAITEIISLLSPISERDLIAYLHSEYGYQPEVIVGTYLTPFLKYKVDGVYDFSAVSIPSDRIEALRAALTEDFYPIKRVHAIYRSLYPDAQDGSVNAGVLRVLGFRVYSKYVLRNYGSLEEYYTHLLMDEGITTIRDKLRRYSETTSFYAVYKRLKNRYDIFLCEPDRIITMQRLERFGVTGEEIRAFADAAGQMVDEGMYFTLHLLRERGFSTSLDRLGLDDFFLAEILAEDPRFASQHVFGAMVLCRTEEKHAFGIADFLFALLSEYTSVEMDDFVSLLQSDYGIVQPDVYKIIELIRNNADTFYYDDIMKTIYRDKSAYLAEFDD